MCNIWPTDILLFRLNVYVQISLLLSLIIVLKHTPQNGLWTLFNLHVNFWPIDLIKYSA